MEFFQRVDPSKAFGWAWGGMNICLINIKLIDYVAVWNFSRRWIPAKRASVWLGGAGMNICLTNIKVIDYVAVWIFSRGWIPAVWLGGGYEYFFDKYQIN